MKSPANQDRLFLLTAGVLLIALLLGGAGNYYPLVTAAVEAAALGLLCHLAWVRSRREKAPLERFGALLALLILLVPVAQLVPLPPQLWTQLPGRELSAEILTVAGLPPGWRPVSLDPEATIRSALELLPGLAMFFACLRLRPADRPRLLKLVVAVAILSALLGGLQKASGGADLFTPFASGHRGLGTGLFVNRNHQATFLLIAMLLAAGTAAGRSSLGAANPAKLVALGLILLFGAGVAATASRTGFILLVPALLISLLLLFPVKITPFRLGAGLVGTIAAAAAALQSSAVRSTLSRFEGGIDDARFEYWSDLMPAISSFWPVGSGVGTFARIFPIFESLDSVGTSFARNAHNDYLEILLETGLPGALLMLLAALFLAGCATQLYRNRGENDSASKIAALAAILLLLLHSVVDYPIRMLSLMAIFGLLAGFIASAPSKARSAKGTRRSRSAHEPYETRQ